MISVTNPVNGNETYTFDAVGNRTASHRSNTYTYQPFNKVSSTQTAAYGSDANGNMTTKGEGSNFWRYVWDYENRMAQASTRKQTVRYKFDALGRRVQRYIPGGRETTKFTYDGDDVVADDDAGVLTKYQNGPGIDNKLRAQTGSDTKYFLADHLGSTNGLTDSTGALTSQTAYDSFGNQTGNLATRYGFTGRERDDFTALVYYRARFYDPNLGRFVSEDPIGFDGGDINLFGYVRNNAVNRTDPLGLFDEAGWLAAREAARAAAAGGSGAGGAIAAGAGPYLAVGAAGLAAGYGIGYYPGHWTSGSTLESFCLRSVESFWNAPQSVCYSTADAASCTETYMPSSTKTVLLDTAV